MNLTEMMSTTALPVQKTSRKDEIRALTSAPAGKIIPLAYVPLLREDRVSRGSVRVKVDMMETVFPLMNAVNVTVMAHLVPFLAFDRFERSLDRLNRSYKGEPDKEGGDVVPFFETSSVNSQEGPIKDIYRVMGIHPPQGGEVNAALVEAYNCVVNFRRKARSTKLPERHRKDSYLARGFWKHNGMQHIVPDFDQAMIDGEVPLSIAQAQMPVKTSGTAGKLTVVDGAGDTREIWSADPTQYDASLGDINAAANAMFAELQDGGITVSLANIEMGKKTAAFAALRKKYAGLEDDAIIDLLMEGIRVPDQQLAQPILLDRKSTILGYSTRYATDAANLDKHVTTGETVVDLRFRTPPVNTGGIVLITAEIVPEQLFERQEDHFLTNTAVEKLPNHTRDYLDPEKVSIVTNQHVDIAHTDPNGTFGYAPLNHEWKRSIPRIGGKYLRQAGDPFIEDRQKFWTVESTDPQLDEHFMLVPELSYDVFADNLADPFEITTLGAVDVVGNTQFGKGLQEDTGDYQALQDQVDVGRIPQPEA